MPIGTVLLLPIGIEVVLVRLVCMRESKGTSTGPSYSRSLLLREENYYIV